MGVAIDDEIECARELFRQPVFQSGRWSPAMGDADLVSFQLQLQHFGHIGGNAVMIHVAEYPFDLCQGGQLIEHTELHPVTAMDNQIGITEIFDQLPGQQLIRLPDVSVGENTDFHALYLADVVCHGTLAGRTGLSRGGGL